MNKRAVAGRNCLSRTASVTGVVFATVDNTTKGTLVTGYWSDVRST
jgi:hypothetical protein